MMIGVFVAERF